MTLVAFHTFVTDFMAVLVAAFSVACVTRSSEWLQVLSGMPYRLAQHIIGTRPVGCALDAMCAMLRIAQEPVSGGITGGHGIGVAILRIGDKYNLSIIGMTPRQHLIRNNQEVKWARTFD
jgi:hypothetical protein